MCEDRNKLYEGRLCLFGLIPLWKVRHPKAEWMREIGYQMYSTKRDIDLEFIDDKESER